MSTPDRKDSKSKAPEKPVVDLSRAAQALVVQTKQSMSQMAALDKKFDAVAKRMQAVAVVGEKIAAFDERLSKIESHLGSLGVGGSAAPSAAGLQEHLDRKLGNLTTRLGKALEEGLANLGAEQKDLRTAIERVAQQAANDKGLAAAGSANPQLPDDFLAPLTEQVEGLAGRIEGIVRAELQAAPPAVPADATFDSDAIVQAVVSATSEQISTRLKELEASGSIARPEPMPATTEPQENVVAEFRRVVEEKISDLKSSLPSSSGHADAVPVDARAIADAVSAATSRQITEAMQAVQASVTASGGNVPASGSSVLDSGALADLQRAIQNEIRALHEKIDRPSPDAGAPDLDIGALTKAISAETAGQVASVLRDKLSAELRSAPQPETPSSAPFSLAELERLFEIKFRSWDDRLQRSLPAASAPVFDMATLTRTVNDVIGSQINRAIAELQSSMPRAAEAMTATPGPSWEEMSPMIERHFRSLAEQLHQSPVFTAELSLDVETLAKSVSSATTQQITSVLASWEPPQSADQQAADRKAFEHLSSAIDQQFLALRDQIREASAVRPELLRTALDPMLLEVRSKISGIEALLLQLQQHQHDADHIPSVDTALVVEQISEATSNLMTQALGAYTVATSDPHVDGLESMASELRLTIEQQMRGVRQEIVQTTGLKAERLRVAMEILLTEFHAKMTDLDAVFATMRRHAEESSRAIQDMALKPVAGAEETADLLESMKLLQSDMARVVDLVSALQAADTTSSGSGDDAAVRAAIIEQISLVQPTIAKAVLSLLDADQTGETTTGEGRADAAGWD